MNVNWPRKDTTNFMKNWLIKRLIKYISHIEFKTAHTYTLFRWKMKLIITSSSSFFLYSHESILCLYQICLQIYNSHKDWQYKLEHISLVIYLLIRGWSFLIFKTIWHNLLKIRIVYSILVKYKSADYELFIIRQIENNFVEKLLIFAN